jgi:uncharacterized membrane protein
LFVIDVDGRLQTCADACEICGDQGYYQMGDEVICRNCTAPIPPHTLGRSGGCNPIPIAARLEGDRLRIGASELEALTPRMHGR